MLNGSEGRKRDTGQIDYRHLSGKSMTNRFRMHDRRDHHKMLDEMNEYPRNSDKMCTFRTERSSMHCKPVTKSRSCFTNACICPGTRHLKSTNNCKGHAIRSKEGS